MADEKIYVGNGVSKFDGDIVEFSVDLSNPGIKEHMFDFNGKTYLKLIVRNKGGDFVSPFFSLPNVKMTNSFLYIAL